MPILGCFNTDSIKVSGCNLALVSVCWQKCEASSPLIVDPSHGKPNPRLSQPQAPKSKAFTGTKLSIGIHSSISAQDSFHIQSSVGTQPSNNTNNSFGTKSLLNTKSPLGTTPLRDTDTYTLSNLTNLKSPVYTSSSTGSLGYETKHVKIDNPNVRYKSVQRQDPLTEEHQKRELSMIKGLNPKYFNPSEVDRFDRCDICGYLFQKGVSEGFFLKKHKDIFHPKYKVSGAGLGKWWEMHVAVIAKRMENK